MNQKAACGQLLNELEKFGAFVWVYAKSGSVYIKFKDCRVGSIRIANHPGLGKYAYRYAVDVSKPDPVVQQQIASVVSSVRKRIAGIAHFDPEKFVIFDKKFRMYVLAKDYADYERHIYNTQEKKDEEHE